MGIYKPPEMLVSTDWERFTHCVVFEKHKSTSRAIDSMNSWLETETVGEWTYKRILPRIKGIIEYYFTDANDAVAFKLTYGT